MIVPFLFIVVTIYLIVYITIKLSKSRKDAENERDAEVQRFDRYEINSSTNVEPGFQRSVRQTYIISPIYTIDSSREPLPYEAALAMPRTIRRSTEITNKSYDDDLPSYDQAIINAKPIETTIEITLNVPKSVTNSDVR